MKKKKFVICWYQADMKAVKTPALIIETAENLKGAVEILFNYYEHFATRNDVLQLYFDTDVLDVLGYLEKYSSPYYFGCETPAARCLTVKDNVFPVCEFIKR